MERKRERSMMAKKSTRACMYVCMCVYVRASGVKDRQTKKEVFRCVFRAK